MLYLYLGFLLTQSHSVISVIYNADISFMTIVFSVVVFFIWSFFPVLGYLLGKLVAKYVGITSHCNKYILFALGCSISLIEQFLFHFRVLNLDIEYSAMIATSFLFFCTAFISIGAKIDAKAK